MNNKLTLDKTIHSSRNVFLDYIKLFMAFLVILIHFGGGKLPSSITLGFTRVAVPFFFIISGFFFFTSDKNYLKVKTKKRFVEALKIVIFSISFYIAFFFIESLISDNLSYFFSSLFSFKSIYRFFAFQYFNPNIQLWYIISYCLVFPVAYLFLKNNKINPLIIATPLLLVNLFLGNYSVFLEKLLI